MSRAFAGRPASHQKKFSKVEGKFSKVEGKFAKVEGKFSRPEGNKFDGKRPGQSFQYNKANDQSRDAFRSQASERLQASVSNTSTNLGPTRNVKNMIEQAKAVSQDQASRFPKSSGPITCPEFESAKNAFIASKSRDNQFQLALDLVSRGTWSDKLDSLVTIIGANPVLFVEKLDALMAFCYSSQTRIALMAIERVDGMLSKIYCHESKLVTVAWEKVSKLDGVSKESIDAIKVHYAFVLGACITKVGRILVTRVKSDQLVAPKDKCATMAFHILRGIKHLKSCGVEISRSTITLFVSALIRLMGSSAEPRLSAKCALFVRKILQHCPELRFVVLQEVKSQYFDEYMPIRLGFTKKVAKDRKRSRNEEKSAKGESKASDESKVSDESKDSDLSRASGESTEQTAKPAQTHEVSAQKALRAIQLFASSISALKWGSILEEKPILVDRSKPVDEPTGSSSLTTKPNNRTGPTDAKGSQIKGNSKKERVQNSTTSYSVSPVQFGKAVAKLFVKDLVLPLLRTLELATEYEQVKGKNNGTHGKSSRSESSTSALSKHKRKRDPPTINDSFYHMLSSSMKAVDSILAFGKSDFSYGDLFEERTVSDLIRVFYVCLTEPRVRVSVSVLKLLLTLSNCGSVSASGAGISASGAGIAVVPLSKTLRLAFNLLASGIPFEFSHTLASITVFMQKVLSNHGIDKRFSLCLLLRFLRSAVEASNPSAMLCAIGLIHTSKVLLGSNAVSGGPQSESGQKKKVFPDDDTERFRDDENEPGTNRKIRRMKLFGQKGSESQRSESQGTAGSTGSAGSAGSAGSSSSLLKMEEFFRTPSFQVDSNDMVPTDECQAEIQHVLKSVSNKHFDYRTREMCAELARTGVLGEEALKSIESTGTHSLADLVSAVVNCSETDQANLKYVAYYCESKAENPGSTKRRKTDKEEPIKRRPIPKQAGEEAEGAGSDSDAKANEFSDGIADSEIDWSDNEPNDEGDEGDEEDGDEEVSQGGSDFDGSEVDGSEMDGSDSEAADFSDAGSEEADLSDAGSHESGSDEQVSDDSE